MGRTAFDAKQPAFRASGTPVAGPAIARAIRRRI